MSAILDLSVDADLDGVRHLRHACERALRSQGLTEEAQSNLCLGVTELATNVVKHAVPPAKHLRMVIQRNAQRWQFSLHDDGGAFAGFNQHLADIEKQSALDSDVLLESGMGLSLIAHLLPGIVRLEQPANCYEWFVESTRPMPVVAVIDDDLILREMIKLYLQDSYQVRLFASPAEAVAVLTKQRVDLVISDIHMPDMDGLTLRRLLSEQGNTALTPFIFVTGQDGQDQRELAYSLGVDDYLKKPLAREHLREVVGRVYQRSQRLVNAAKQWVDSGITLQLQPKVPVSAGGFSLALAHQTADVGGGDFVFHRVDNALHTLVLGDCMGHGTQAKVFVHAYQAYLSSSLSNIDVSAGAGQILAQLSHAMQVDELLGQSLLTCLVVQWQPDGLLQLASAGHPMPWLFTSSDAQQVRVGGVLPGLVAGVSYPVTQLRLSAGERLCLYTDGLLAGLAPLADEAKALQKLTELLQTSASYSLPEQAKWLLAQGASHYDDACVLLMQADS